MYGGTQLISNIHIDIHLEYNKNLIPLHQKHDSFSSKMQLQLQHQLVYKQKGPTMWCEWPKGNLSRKRPQTYTQFTKIYLIMEYKELWPVVRREGVSWLEVTKYMCFCHIIDSISPGGGILPFVINILPTFPEKRDTHTVEYTTYFSLYYKKNLFSLF